MLSDQKFIECIEAVKPYTMVPAESLEMAMRSVLEVIEHDIPGVIVECGVWRGGCSAAMLLAQQAEYGEVRRPIFMLDSYEGLPPITQEDGPLAGAYQRQELDEYLDNCRADIEEARAAMTSFGFREGTDFHLIKGWFEDTASTVAEQLKASKIAILRLDGDWYSSTLTCLNALEPVVAQDGLVLIDDYYAWDGCARAVHEYLTKHELPYRIQSTANFGSAFFSKRAFRNADTVLFAPFHTKSLKMKAWLDEQSATIERQAKTISELKAWSDKQAAMLRRLNGLVRLAMPWKR